ncbi:hypothetical protein D9M71_524780 [compost metagenome]
MPGRIIAQMAMAPAKNRLSGSCPHCIGAATVIHQANRAPRAKLSQLGQFQRLISRPTNQVDTTIRPKKNDQMAIG